MSVLRFAIEHTSIKCHTAYSTASSSLKIDSYYKFKLYKTRKGAVLFCRREADKWDTTHLFSVKEVWVHE